METAEIHLGITVAIVSFGDYSGLLRTVSSVLEQNCRMEQIILSDDGSGKPFPQEVLDLLGKASCPVVIRQGEKNLGTTAHLNLLAGMCAGEYIKFLGAGDAFSDPQALEALVNHLRQSNAMVVTSQVMVASADLQCRYYTFPGSRCRRIRENAGAELFRVLAQGNIISAVGVLFRRSFFLEFGGFDESYRLLEDWPAWLRMAREGHEILFLDRVTCLYALGGVSSGSGNAYLSRQLHEDMLLCYEKEILPGLSACSPAEKRCVQYHYEMLQGCPRKQLLRKYFRLELTSRLKRGIKCALLKRNRGNCTH